jgi:hypothetical protein
VTKGLEGWNLDIAPWRELEALMPDAAWTTLTFESLSWNRVPAMPGVYMVTGGPPLLRSLPHSKFGKPLYIGESTTSIQMRFRAHAGARCQPSLQKLRQLYDEARYPMLYFHFLQLPADVVAKAETVLIECYAPPANRKRGVTIRPGVPAG